MECDGVPQHVVLDNWLDTGADRLPGFQESGTEEVPEVQDDDAVVDAELW